MCVENTVNGSSAQNDVPKCKQTDVQKPCCKADAHATSGELNELSSNLMYMYLL
jgi:hypothetical protein